MFNTTGNIQYSFYNQTGDCQFNFNLLIDTLFGYTNIGLSGYSNSGLYGASNINFNCSSGKIFDNNNRFVGAYTPNSVFSLSGNISNNSYNIFINGKPIEFNQSKSTGTYNYIYIKPQNTNISYNTYINGYSPALYFTTLQGNTGLSNLTGTILNSGLPITIYSGYVSNLDSIPISFTFNTGSVKNSIDYLVNLSGAESLGNYTGNLELTTNAGLLKYPIYINVTGDPITNVYSFNLNGDNTIENGLSNLFTSDIENTIGSGIPIVVSLEYISGSGIFYTNIDVNYFYSGNITGEITGSGIINQFITGQGTGIGGLLNLSGSGMASGYISGDFIYSTGNFVWPYTVRVSGYGSGLNYTGLGTGDIPTQITGTILSGSGFYIYNSSIVINPTNIYSSGATGYISGTGGILYNTPIDYDKLYINDANSAILYNYHYTSAATLVNYLNSSTGVHLVKAGYDGVNTILLTGLRGIDTNVSMWTDVSNIGNMQTISSSLIGGQDLGIGQLLYTIGNSTGNINNSFIGSGTYIETGMGDVVGSGNIINYIKTFTGSWNLLTGNISDMIDYYIYNYYNIEQTKYYNNLPIYFVNSTLTANVAYTNNYDTLPDVAKLTISGVNTNSGLSILITGNYTN